MISNIRTEARKELRDERRDRHESDIDWQLYVNRLEKLRTEAVRDTVHELREYQHRMQVERNEAATHAAEVDERAAELAAALDRVRCTSKAGLLEQVAALQSKVRELGARRKANQRKVSDCNLALKREKSAKQEAAKEQERFNNFIGTGIDLAARSRQLEASNAEALSKLASLQQELKDSQAEAAKHKAVAEPAKSKFFESAHFSAAVDQVIIELMCCGVARNKLPQLFVIFARFYGILIPGRPKKVPGPWVDGRRTTVERFVYYLPGKSHVKEMAAVMNQLNKLQMGEWLMQHIESDAETSCCYLADGAESQQVLAFTSLSLLTTHSSLLTPTAPSLLAAHSRLTTSDNSSPGVLMESWRSRPSLSTRSAVRLRMHRLPLSGLRWRR